MSTPSAIAADWTLPDRGRVGIAGLIIAESAVFAIFVVAYVFYVGKNLSGPTPHQVLDLPIVASLVLWSSSVTIALAVRALRADARGPFTAWWAVTILLGTAFLAGTAIEWHRLIYTDGLTIRTNLFGTTFYSLVGLHAFHVVVGLVLMSVMLAAAVRGQVGVAHAGRAETLSLYWHFVDAVWVVVFLVVYVGRG
jgi:cytochrome c oxidase subunit 3